MKVLISGTFWHGSLEESYARAFEAIGWKVVRFDWEQYASAHPLSLSAFTDKLLRMKIADRVGKQFVAAIEETRPDIVFVIKGRTISADTLAEAKKILRDRPLLNFNPDSPWDKANHSKRLIESIPIYDVHFTWNTRLMEPFRTSGASSVSYLPFAYDPVLHQPLGLKPIPEYDAMFIGTYSAERDALLGTLSGCDIRIAGNGWEKATHIPKHWVISKARYGHDAVHILGNGMCSINILRQQNEGSHNMRTFEIPATANPMLTTRSEEQAQWFTEGTDMECYSTPEELKEKIVLLSQKRDYARELAKNGYCRVREEIYAKRAGTIVSFLGLS
ncbi:MAG TPA: glycosyltransferase [Candidatus Kapabacteria bacterium]|jgi:spore maturation protein CgeB